MNQSVFRVGSWTLLGAWALVGLVGCYSRIELKPKATPPASKIGLSFGVSPDAYASIDAAAQQARNQPGVDASQVQQQVAQAKVQLESLPANITGMLKSELLKKNLGFPVVDDGVETDLTLRGSFRAASLGGLALDWELLEVRSGAVIRAGTTESYSMSWGNVDEAVDNILTELLAINVDAYAVKGGSGVTAPTASAGTLDEPIKAGTDGSKTWVVIIGVERYREALPEATGAEHDARIFAEYAKATFGVPEAHIKMLVGDRASRADITSAIEEWLPRNAVESGGRVIVYFSGHGAPDVESGDAYLVPWDADPAYIRTRGYPMGELVGQLSKLKGQQSLVFVDACFSGVGDRTVLAAGTRPLVPVKEPVGATGVIALTASSAKQATGGHSEGRHGLFTYHLLDGLRGGADANGDKNVNLGELSVFVKERVEREARLQNREQTPVLTLPSGVKAESVVVVQGLP